MSNENLDSELIEKAALEAANSFAREIGVTDIGYVTHLIGNELFLDITVGRKAPIYDRAIREASRKLPVENVFRGLFRLNYQPISKFPESLECKVLQGLLISATRTVAQATKSRTLAGPFVPFQNNEDQKVIQPATQIIHGRRGVGKSTLIRRAVELLQAAQNICVVLDMQAYAQRTDEGVIADVCGDLTAELAKQIQERESKKADLRKVYSQLVSLSNSIIDGQVGSDRISSSLKRIISELSSGLEIDIFVFMDDFHLIHPSLQPRIAHIVHGALKGAGGWLKIAGLSSFLHCYDAQSKLGLQTPGDAQLIALDLTLVAPGTAETHLQSILEGFLRIVGIEKASSVIQEGAFKRLVWASAGVPRDFLQMFSSSIEHARRAARAKVAITDANLSIGEFAQPKMQELEQDAQNEGDKLKRVLSIIEDYCLGTKQINAFLTRQEGSAESQYIQRLSDLRIVHLLHQTITPDRAGERYEAYMLDYSLYTGFRRRPGITEIAPEEGDKGFTASQLRKLPKLKLPEDLFQNKANELHSQEE